MKSAKAKAWMVLQQLPGAEPEGSNFEFRAN